MRNEYLLRDSLRAEGYIADRVPSSGAAEGFKGDIKFFDQNGVAYLAELKARKSSFGRIYALYNQYKDALGVLQFATGEHCVGIYPNMAGATAGGGVYDFARFEPSYNRTLTKIVGMRQFLKGCDILVIKDDRMPFLYIKYR